MGGQQCNSPRVVKLGEVQGRVSEGGYWEGRPGAGVFRALQPALRSSLVRFRVLPGAFCRNRDSQASG